MSIDQTVQGIKTLYLEPEIKKAYDNKEYAYMNYLISVYENNYCSPYRRSTAINCNKTAVKRY